jgi:hypothetical protein
LHWERYPESHSYQPFLLPPAAVLTSDIATVPSTVTPAPVPAPQPAPEPQPEPAPVPPPVSPPAPPTAPTISNLSAYFSGKPCTRAAIT